jgi:hypothetical protein
VLTYSRRVSITVTSTLALQIEGYNFDQMATTLRKGHH